jgi:hypothetical protein
MSFAKAAPPTPQERWGAQGKVSIADRTNPIAKPSSHPPQAVPLRAELIGDSCTAAGLTVSGRAPVLGLCRSLIAAGFDSSRSLHCYRGTLLALIVRHIGEAAKLRIATHGVGFERLPECTTASLVLETDPAHTRRRTR